MKRYKIGVIGAGARGESFARELYQGSRRAELFGICDIDKDRLDKFCDYCQFTKVRKFTNTQEFLSQPELDAVIVTVPEFAHKEVSVAAMKAGKPVYVEKPLAHNYADCVEMINTSRKTKVLVYVGFNLRASLAYQKMKEIVASGVLGTLVHASGMEVLAVPHGASFMRRFHRKSANSGGLLNHKCCHDIDIMLWVIGHPKVKRIASFGGTRIFTPDKQPATHCSKCPVEIYTKCPYYAKAGYVFPVGGDEPIYHSNSDLYGGDLCVYTPDKDLVDHQVSIIEFENGLRGDFTLEMFGAGGRRRTVVRGEKGVVEFDSGYEPNLRLVLSNGDTTVYNFAKRPGGHGGTDPYMISRFIDAIESGTAGESGLDAGLGAAIVAFKADQSRLSGKIVDVPASEYV